MPSSGSHGIMENAEMWFNSSTRKEKSESQKTDSVIFDTLEYPSKVW